MGLGASFTKNIFPKDNRLPEQKIIECSAFGGFGNLMFEYAATYAYAREHNKVLYVDGLMTELEDAFGLKIKYISKETPSYSNLTPQRRKEVNVRKAEFAFYDSSFKTDDSYGRFHHHFQNPKFFLKYEKEIRRLFSFKKELSQENKKLLRKIKKTNSVSMHIRRGDYINEPEKFFLISPAYYEKAAEYIAKRVKRPHFYIFSDDMNWARENIRLKYPQTFVDINYGKESYNDMHLMSACKHNVIANSTFSWWGAWLNKNSNKIVIAPDVWLKDGGLWGENILPKEWIKMQANPIH